MSGEEDKKRNWLPATIGSAAAVIAFAASSLTLWINIDNRIKDTATESTVRITQEIKDSTTSIYYFQRNDLKLRIRNLEREIKASQDAGDPIPERKIYLLQDYKRHLDEMQEQWREKWGG